MSTLEIAGVSHSYGARVALQNVNLTIHEGVTALIGVNGAGKSTLLNIAAGGLAPSSGLVCVGGRDIYSWRSRRRALGKVALMPQSAAFPGNLTALEVVEYLTWMRGISGSAARKRASDALDRVELSSRAKDKFKTLSGGMQRRVGLAQALAGEPDVLLLDEPSTGLDPKQRRIMVDLLRELPGAVVLSSHVMEDVADLAQRAVVIDSGRIVFDGSLPELQAHAPNPLDARASEAGFLAVLASDRGGER